MGQMPAISPGVMPRSNPSGQYDGSTFRIAQARRHSYRSKPRDNRVRAIEADGRGCKRPPGYRTVPAFRRDAAGGRRTTDTWSRSKPPDRLIAACPRSSRGEALQPHQRSSRIPRAATPCWRSPMWTTGDLRFVERGGRRRDRSWEFAPNGDSAAQRPVDPSVNAFPR